MSLCGWCHPQDAAKSTSLTVKRSYRGLSSTKMLHVGIIHSKSYYYSLTCNFGNKALHFIRHVRRFFSHVHSSSSLLQVTPWRLVASSVGMTMKVRVMFPVQTKCMAEWRFCWPQHKVCLMFNHSLITCDRGVIIASFRKLWEAQRINKSILFCGCWSQRFPVSLPDLLTLAFPVADFVTGVPKGHMLYGVVRGSLIFIYNHFTVQTVDKTNKYDVHCAQVSILNGRDLEPLLNLTGEQVCAHLDCSLFFS